MEKYLGKNFIGENDLINFITQKLEKYLCYENLINESIRILIYVVFTNNTLLIRAFEKFPLQIKIYYFTAELILTLSVMHISKASDFFLKKKHYIIISLKNN